MGVVGGRRATAGTSSTSGARAAAEAIAPAPPPASVLSVTLRASVGRRYHHPLNLTLTLTLTASQWGDVIIIHVAAVAVFTLVINAPTTAPLLRVLKLTTTPEVTKRARLAIQDRVSSYAVDEAATMARHPVWQSLPQEYAHPKRLERLEEFAGAARGMPRRPSPRFPPHGSFCAELRSWGRCPLSTPGSTAPCPRSSWRYAALRWQVAREGAEAGFFPLGGFGRRQE